MSERKDIHVSSAVSSPTLEKLLDVLDGFRVAKALFVACDFGIFDKLHTASKPQSAREITQTMSSDLDATSRLLDTLVSLEFLEKTKQGDQWLYSNTEMSTKFLTTSSPVSQLGIIALDNKVSYPLFGNFKNAVLDGSTQWMKTFGKSPEDVFRDQISSTREESLKFNRAMHCSALLGSNAVAKAIDLSA